MAKKKEVDREVDTEAEAEATQETAEEARSSRLSEIFKAVHKKHGDNSIVFAKDFRYPSVHRITTGILPLDYALGGGLPVGRVSVSFGHKSSAKTTNLLRSVGNAQKMCSQCWTNITDSCVCGARRKVIAAWIDAENVWEHSWSSKFLNVDELLLSQPENAEQTIDLADSLIRSGDVDIVVIDSIASMTPSQEINKSAAESTMGLQAKLMSLLMRKVVSGVSSVANQADGRRPTVWLTNQLRQKVGLVFGNPEVQPGGLGSGFAASVEIRHSPGKYEMDSVTGKPLYAEMKAKVEKNKTAPPKMECEYKMMLSKTDLKDVGDILDEDWALSMGEKVGLIQVAHARVEWNGRTFQGKSKLTTHWAKDRADYEEFKKQLMPIILSV